MRTPARGANGALRAAEVLRAFAPLAASWAFMSAELPVVAAFMTRLEGGEVHLAAFGGVVFPVALSVEAPVIMLLSASTALSTDRRAYDGLRRFSHRLGAGLSLLHAALALTPLYGAWLVPLLDVPEVLVAPARQGLVAMIPWTWAIAHRRFEQGALIRAGHAREVGFGTVVRFGTVMTVLAAAWAAASVPAILAVTGALSLGVLAEALYADRRARRLVVPHLPRGTTAPLRGLAFARFFVPLAVTPMLTMMVMPVVAGAIARMPDPVVSLALWPVVHGVVFHLQSYALAFHEVAVAHLGRRGARPVLARFAWGLAAVLGGATVLLCATPLSRAYFTGFVGLSARQAELAAVALWLALPLPVLRARVSYTHGLLVAGRRTGPITESVALFLCVTAAAMAVLAETARLPGIVSAYVALSTARIVETAWVEIRARRRDPARPDGG